MIFTGSCIRRDATPCLFLFGGVGRGIVAVAVFIIILLLLICRLLFLSLLFVAQKVTKRHSIDKISHSLLCSQIFASENIAFGELRLRSLQV